MLYQVVATSTRCFITGHPRILPVILSYSINRLLITGDPRVLPVTVRLC